jgi:hypothetical protein
MAAAQTVAERQRLQGLLHARSDANELMAMSQQDLQIALFARRHPDRGETIFHQQREQQTSIAAVVFLLARFGSPDLRRMATAVVDSKFFQKSQEPVHRPSGFDVH